MLYNVNVRDINLLLNNVLFGETFFAIIYRSWYISFLYLDDERSEERNIIYA